MNGFTGTVKVPYGTTMDLEYPDGAEAARFGSADCAGDPISIWTEDFSSDVSSSDYTSSYQARWIDEPTNLSNCVTVIWRDAPVVKFDLSGVPSDPPYTFVAGYTVWVPTDLTASGPKDGLMRHILTATVADMEVSRVAWLPNDYLILLSGFEYADISQSFVDACIDGNLQISVEVASWFGMIPIPDEQYVFHREYTLQIPCNIGIAPVNSLTIQEICANRDNQANDLVEFNPQTGVVVADAAYTGSIYNIDVVPTPGYAFLGGVTEVRFSHTDASQQCAPSLLTVDETSQALVGIHAGDTVMIPATLSVPAGQPYSSASFAVLDDVDVSDDPSAVLPRGSASEIPVDIAFTTPENFAEACVAGNGSVVVEVTANMSGPYILGGLELEEASFNATGTLPCDVAQWVTPDISRITQSEVCGPQNDTFATDQPGFELVFGDWTDGSREISFVAADGFDLAGDVPPQTVSDANVQCQVDHLTIMLNSSDDGSLEDAAWAV